MLVATGNGRSQVRHHIHAQPDGERVEPALVRYRFVECPIDALAAAFGSGVGERVEGIGDRD